MTDLHFCNFCDQSVPISQLDNGDAIRHGGRVVCPTCCDALAMATRSDSARKGGGGWLALVFALVAWAGVGFVYVQQDIMRRDNAENLNGAVLQLAGSLSTQGEKLAAGAARQEELLGDFKAITQQGFSTAYSDLAGLDEAITAVRRQIESLGGLADGQSSLEQETRALRTQLQVTEESVREVRKGLEFLRDGYAELERKMVLATQAPAEETGFSPKVKDLLNNLKAEDPLTRVAAIEELGKHQDPALIPYVEPMLQDSYEMTRYYAAYTLGQWQAMASVPALIVALEDEFAFVNEAVNEALVAITKEDMGFNSKGSANERRQAIARWQAWWDKQSP